MCVLRWGTSTPSWWGSTGVLPLLLWGECQGQGDHPDPRTAGMATARISLSQPAHKALSPGAPSRCLQEKVRHTTVKNITSVLFGICYSAWLTGYKYILQQISSPSALPRGRGRGVGRGCAAPGSRASRPVRHGRQRRQRLPAGPSCTETRYGVPTRTPAFSCLSRPWVPAPAVGGLRMGCPAWVPRQALSADLAAPKPLEPHYLQLRVVQWLPAAQQVSQPWGSCSQLHAGYTTPSGPARAAPAHVSSQARAGITLRPGKGPGEREVGSQITASAPCSRCSCQPRSTAHPCLGLALLSGSCAGRAGTV
ncbi:uncharacterized protein LOC127389491 isoform X2 [Apus apus]|uniref:uncharacterized protein LOC127389491 isoform X2 n=1 Tax=Apus apus TaxID=8895 RepID=UPI0021F8C4C6|nr:uncharacterized protein LOC127389491 isoform X2 [Apus apus]